MAKIQRFGKAAVSTTVTQIIPYHAKRTGILIRHYSGNPVFISNDQVDILENGYPLSVGEFLSFLSTDGDVPELQLYAVTSAGTSNLRIIETYGEV